MPELDLDSETSAIWHMLLDTQKSTEAQLTEIYEEHQRTGKSFLSVVYNYGIITEEEFLQHVAENLGTEYVNLREIEIDRGVIALISSSVARMYGIVPMREEDNLLVVAAKDAMNYRMIDELHYVLGRDCRVVVAKPSDIDDALDHFYPQQVDSVSDVIAEMELNNIGNVDVNEDDTEAIQAMASNAPIVRFVDVILYQAIKDQASDIHFEPFAEEFRIRYRIDGALYEMAPPPKHLTVPVISRIKVLSNLNISERRHPQDGRIELRIAGRPVDLRVSTLPTQYGESVVLRVLDRSVVNLDIEVLGIPSGTVATLRSLINQPNGIVIVTGPTGSGKTTTLYSCLKEINHIGDKLLTAEDPVEYDIEGIMQVPVKESVGMTFFSALRAFLRQDPDRIMIGEMRDVETARMAIQASLTGHFVLTTLHTNDSAGAVTRLVDMGVEPFLISSTLLGVIGQRLIRKICVQCKAEYQPEENELKMLGLTKEEIGGKPFFYGKGCENCNNSGYRGRIGIFELLKMSKGIEGLINQKLPTDYIRNKAIEEGMDTMRQNGIRMVLDGITSAEEVLKYT